MCDSVYVVILHFACYEVEINQSEPIKFITSYLFKLI